MDEFQTKWMISNKMDDFKQRGVLQEYAVNLGKKSRYLWHKIIEI